MGCASCGHKYNPRPATPAAPKGATGLPIQGTNAVVQQAPHIAGRYVVRVPPAFPVELSRKQIK